MSFTVMMDTEEGLLENIVNEVSREDGDQSVISLLSLYRSCTLVNHAFLRAVKEMPSEFDGTVISYEHFASVMFTGGKYIEEEEAEEDAKFIPEGAIKDPYGVMIIRDTKDEGELKIFLTENILGTQLFTIKPLDVVHVARLLSCQDSRYRMHSAECIWNTGAGDAALMLRDGKPWTLCPTALRTWRSQLMWTEMSAVPFKATTPSRHAIFTPSVKSRTTTLGGVGLNYCTGGIGLVDSLYDDPDDIDANMAHFPLELLKIMGAGACPDTMRGAGVVLLADVLFETRVPTYPTAGHKGCNVQQWVLERVSQARSLRKDEERRRASIEAGTFSPDRPEKREAAKRAETLSVEQARAEQRLDSKGRFRRGNLPADMREEEEYTGQRNADFVHDDSDDSDGVFDKHSDSDADYCE